MLTSIYHQNGVMKWKQFENDVIKELEFKKRRPQPSSSTTPMAVAPVPVAPPPVVPVPVVVPGAHEAVDPVDAAAALLAGMELDL